MLILENLSFKYPDGIEYEFNLELKDGDSLAVMGPSGAGKSTLLNLIAGFLASDAGRISFNNQDLTDLAPNERPVNMLFQEHNLFQHLSVFDNVALGISSNLKVDDQQRSIIENSLLRVGLLGINDKLPHQLSGGQKQRVALARTLVRKKPILLLDEPFSFLDLDLHEAMLGLIKSIQQDQELTMILITHNPDDAAKICNKISVIENGKILLY